jgi:hypothetical protein
MVTTAAVNTAQAGQANSNTITDLPPKAAQKSSDTAVSTIKVADSPSIHYSSSYEVNSNQSHQKSTQPPTSAVFGSGGLQLSSGMGLGAGLGLGNAMPVIATPKVAPTVTAPATPAPGSDKRDAVTIPVTVKHSICFDKTEGDKSGQMRI